MINKGTIIVRLKSNPDAKGNRKGHMFQAASSHPTNAFFDENHSLAPGYFSLASEEEQQLFAQGKRAIELNKRAIKDFTELNNFMALKQNEAEDEKEVEGTVINKLINPHKHPNVIISAVRAANGTQPRWNKESVIKLIGYVRGVKKPGKRIKLEQYAAIGKILGRSAASCSQMYQRVKNAPPKKLKKLGITLETFHAIPAISLKMTPIKSVAAEKISDVGVVENLPDAQHIEEEKVVEPSLVVQAMLLLVQKLNKEEKLYFIDQMF